MKKGASLMILESPATFVFRVVDLKAIADLAHKYGVRTYIDNTCMTPIFQNPLDLGIDIVMHTMSKYIGGHSDLIGGVLVSKDDELMKQIIQEMREWYGGILGRMAGDQGTSDTSCKTYATSEYSDGSCRVSRKE